MARPVGLRGAPHPRLSGETGDLQSFLELAGRPHLGCDAEASKICFNKITTKLASAIGIPNTLSVPDRAKRRGAGAGESRAGQAG